MRLIHGRLRYIAAFNMAAVSVVMVEFSGIKYSGYMGFRSKLVLKGDFNFECF